MKVSIESCSGGDLFCGKAAAICTGSQNYKSALRHSVESGHTSVLEHCVFTFRVEGISRVTLAQLTRHRIASFSVQSQRYVKMDKTEFVVPETVKNSTYCAEYAVMMKDCMDLYHRMIQEGIPAEDARYIIPQAATTQLYMTMNARELLHFFSLRCCNRAQWEIREMADKMLELCKEKAPLIFENAGAGCVRGHCPEKRPCGKPRKKEE